MFFICTLHAKPDHVSHPVVFSKFSGCLLVTLATGNRMCWHLPTFSQTVFGTKTRILIDRLCQFASTVTLWFPEPNGCRIMFSISWLHIKEPFHFVQWPQTPFFSEWTGNHTAIHRSAHGCSDINVYVYS